MKPNKFNVRLVLHTVHMSILADPTRTRVLVNRFVPVDHMYWGGGDDGAGGDGSDDGGCATKAMAAAVAADGSLMRKDDSPTKGGGQSSIHSTKADHDALR
jgi:hypothetical protein